MLRFNKLAILALAAALLPTLVHSGKETLTIQIGKDKNILDTVWIWIDYESFPEVKPAKGAWTDYEKDSAYLDENLHQNVRYNHSFLASKGPRKGYGVDHIHYYHDGQNAPQYTANVSFSFPGDTTEGYSWEPSHMEDNPDVPEAQGIKSGHPVFGQVSKYVGGGAENLVLGQWAKVLIRENGWVGSGGSTSLRAVKQISRAEGWFFHLAPGTVLRPPPGVKALKVLDVQGHLHWETKNLLDGALLTLPEGLPRGALRYHWVSESDGEN